MKRARGVRRRGQIYENKAIGYLRKKTNLFILPKQWFRFKTEKSNKWRFCEVDSLGLDMERGVISVIEIKTRHTVDAYWQLEYLYIPVVKKVFGDLWEYAPIEVVRFFDPHTQFPVNPVLLKHVEKALPRNFSVHICPRP